MIRSALGRGMLGFGAVLLLVVGAYAQDDERIVRFHSDITILEDASLTVVETITVRCARDQIRRGIYRDFPTRYRGKWYIPVRVKFEIVSLKRNGNPEPYHTEDLSNGVRTYFGSENELLSIGEHTYEFTYQTDRQLGFFDEHDELYWNVTGTDWDFPIDDASATVHFPGPVSSSRISTDGYTGPQGSKEQAYEAQIEDDGTVEFRATRALAPHEGLTIVAAFPKGMVSAPEPNAIAKEIGRGLLKDSSRLTGLLLVFAYFVIVWYMFGRDPAAGQIVPQSAPPKGISPAAARYIERMGFDNMAFTAALVSLSVKGYVQIIEEDGEYRIEQVQPPAADLPSEERKIMENLLPAGMGIRLVRRNHSLVSGALTGCNKALKKSFQKSYFITNTRYYLPGFLLSLAVLVGAVLSLPKSNGAPVIFLSIWLSIWTLGVVALATQVYTLWRGVLTGKGGIGQAVFMTIFSTPFFIAEVVVGGIFVYQASWVVVALMILLVVMNVVFFRLLKAPTGLGRKTLDALEGYKQYLSGERWSRYGGSAEDVTPAMFEEHLAYAIAFGIEDEWSKRFDGVLGASSNDPDAGRPRWYRGSGWNHRNPALFATALGASLSTAVASSSTAPGSSSGSGGGGSSGGGGGGGGGGGW
ncbi:MAG: DUF2207 domain-containing protein [Candidatus Hydrogenedentes bacterium]|nr:DUF2207 domain-containing protein [Candidatus Hydrogenedentota bacterium]